MNVRWMRRSGLSAVAALALASPLALAQSRSAEDSAAALRMRETGIQGERQRPDVLFVIPTGRTGPIVSARLRDYSYEIQEPVVKMWLEGETRIAHSGRGSSAGLDFDWREAVEAAKQASTQRRVESGAVPQIQRPSGPSVAPPGIPSEALSGRR